MPHYYHFFFFFNATATTEIYTLSLHDALPISTNGTWNAASSMSSDSAAAMPGSTPAPTTPCSRSEEHTSELQSHVNLVCRLLLEKKKKNKLHQKVMLVLIIDTDLARSHRY